jgi:hypothetical protein
MRANWGMKRGEEICGNIYTRSRYKRAKLLDNQRRDCTPEGTNCLLLRDD